MTPLTPFVAVVSNSSTEPWSSTPLPPTGIAENPAASEHGSEWRYWLIIIAVVPVTLIAIGLVLVVRKVGT